MTRLIRARRPRAVASSHSAYTLMEVLIVVGIMGIMASVVVPAMRSSGAQTVDSVARVLAADLRLARNQAIQYNTQWSVTFDFVNNRYDLVHTGTGSPPALVDPLAPASQVGGPYRIEIGKLGVNTGQTNGIELSFAELKTAHTPVTNVAFTPLGGTGPARQDDTVIWLTAGTGGNVQAVKLTVSWVTGHVWVGDVEMLANAP